MLESSLTETRYKTTKTKHANMMEEDLVYEGGRKLKEKRKGKSRAKKRKYKTRSKVKVKKHKTMAR